MMRKALALLGILLAAACASSTTQFTEEAASNVEHVVIVVQENRSFDNLFHRYQGADTTDYGMAHDGTRVRLQPVSLAAHYDISNNVRDFLKSYRGGKMDGFDLRLIGPRPGAQIPLAALQYPEYAYVPRAESAPYFQIAHEFVLADRMFQSNIDQSFVAHLYLIAGQANRTADIPSGRPWGCDAGPAARVPTLKENRTLGPPIFPCFDIPTLADELEARRLSWAYYAPEISDAASWRRPLPDYGDPYSRRGQLDAGQLWSSFDAIPHERFGPLWQTNVISPSSRFLTDVAAGRLRSVSWVVPDYVNSDHAGSRSTTGPSIVSPGVVYEPAAAVG